MRRVRRALLVAAVAMTAATCGDPTDPGRALTEALESARARWAAAGPSSYSYDWHPVVGEGQTVSAHVTVTDGVVTAVEPIGEVPPVTVGPEPGTVEELFDLLATSLASDPHRALIRYDAELGYPAEASFDVDARMVDDEWGFSLRNFQPAAP